MKADEIRDRWLRAGGNNEAEWLKEIALQLAELNEIMRDRGKKEEFRSTFERVFG